MLPYEQFSSRHLLWQTMHDTLSLECSWKSDRTNSGERRSPPLGIAVLSCAHRIQLDQAPHQHSAPITGAFAVQRDFVRPQTYERPLGRL